jgi:hypothetical protein
MQSPPKSDDAKRCNSTLAIFVQPILAHQSKPPNVLSH